ncbi:hypothetical protein FM106_02260 [Brachybacterium faecium]|nr:hypothetical protein FM106_02260 [Brachybacterium faecium]
MNSLIENQKNHPKGWFSSVENKYDFKTFYFFLYFLIIAFMY